MSDEYICPNCESILDLNENEKIKGKIRCPECNALINFKTKPFQIIENENYIELLLSYNQADIAMLKSILDNYEIDYYLSGEGFFNASPMIQPVKFYINEK